MKTLFFFVLFFLIGLTALWAEPAKGRYYYDPEDKVMVDTDTGKAYGFIQLVSSSEYTLTEIDYVQGTVTPIKSVQLDDREHSEAFSKIKQAESSANWAQRMAAVLASWRRSGN